MSKSKYISIIIIQFIIIFTLVINTNKPKEIMNDNNTKIVKKNKDTISMMLETEAGSGNYEMTTRDSWPTEGYIFNNDLSKCDHGSELSWDDTNKAVVMTGNMSDKCYVYFDKVEKAVINEILTSDITTESITLTISANKGTYDINKYFYSIDNGLTWNESTSNIIVVSNLTKGTEYTIKVYVQDVMFINSQNYTKTIKTKKPYILPIGTKLNTKENNCGPMGAGCDYINVGEKIEFRNYSIQYITDFEVTTELLVLEAYMIEQDYTIFHEPIRYSKSYLYHDKYYVIVGMATDDYFVSYRLSKEGYEDMCINAYKKEVVDCNNERWMYTGKETSG